MIEIWKSAPPHQKSQIETIKGYATPAFEIHTSKFTAPLIKMHVRCNGFSSREKLVFDGEGALTLLREISVATALLCDEISAAGYQKSQQEKAATAITILRQLADKMEAENQ